jgi:hypothetical protein
MLIQLQDGKPTGHAVLESNFRKLFSNTSFPSFLTPENVEPFGFGMYDFATQPEPGKYEKIVEVEAVKDEQGIYRQTWAVVDTSNEERAAEDERKANEALAERNTRLAASDWTQIADSPVDKQTWATYRQALRDITDHVNFPYLADEDWPVKP